VAQSAPNPADAPASVDRDFLGQGVGNIASSLVRGMPVGGSVGQTALNVASGARSRWAAIFSGLWLLLILLALSKLVGLVAQPTLAALLIVAAVGSIHPSHITSILRTSATSRVALVATFIATLFLPVATAVGFGVALSLILQLNQEAMDLKIVRLVPTPAGWREEKPERFLASGTVTVLDVYGSLLYAGSRTLQSHLPDPTGSKPAAVVIRLRGRTELGATFFVVIQTYAKTLHDEGGRLYLSGVDPHLGAQWERNRRSPEHDLLEVFQATPMVGASTDAAIERANRWVREH
jgi:SulP family sulfate permease